MQIHELTSRRRTDENFMTNLAKAAGNAVKDTVGSAVQGVKDKAGQIGAQLKDPKAWVSTKAATAAKGGAQLKQQTSRYAQQLAGEWAQQSKQLVGAEAKAKMAGTKQPTTPLKQAPQKTTGATQATQKSTTTAPSKPGAEKTQAAGATKPNQPVQSMADFAKQYPTAKYHEVTGEITPYGQQQAALKAQTDKEQQAATAAKYKQQAADKAAAEAPPAAPATTTAAPGAATAPATRGTFDPTDKKAVTAFKKQMKGLGSQIKGDEPVSIGGQKLNPKDPKQAELIAKARAADKPPVTEAFSDLPGAKPQAGGPVDPKVTAPTVGKKGNPLTSAYITAFKKWADSKLSTRESNTGETITMQSVAKENPQVDKGLRLALANIYNTRQDPKANEQAVTAYLTQAITAIQQIAAKMRSENPKSAARGSAKSAPGQMDSQTAQMARSMNLSQDNLDKMKQVIDAAGEKVTSGTGSPTIDNLLVASGLLK